MAFGSRGAMPASRGSFATTLATASSGVVTGVGDDDFAVPAQPVTRSATVAQDRRMPLAVVTAAGRRGGGAGS